MTIRIYLIAPCLLMLSTISASCHRAPEAPQGETQAAEATVPPAPSAEQDITAIRALQAAWNQAVEAGNADGYIAVLDDNIELLPTDAPPINGTDGYRDMLDGVFGANTFDIEIVDLGTVEVAGDIGWARYDYIIHRTPVVNGAKEPRTVSSLRKFIDIMRRQPDGSWRVYKHIWNYNEPGVVP